MKRILTSALVLALAIGSAQAQDTTSHKAKGHKKEHKMHGEQKKMDKKEVNLTAEQKVKLQAIKETYRNESEALRANTTLTAEQKQAERKRIHEKFRTESAAILTPEQKQHMQEMKGERGKDKMDKGDRMGKGHKGHDKMMEKGQEMKKELNLTAAQESKMKQVRASYKAKFDALRDNSTLTQEQKRAQMKELMEAQKEEMKGILTKEQQDKMQSLKKDRPMKKATK